MAVIPYCVLCFLDWMLTLCKRRWVPVRPDSFEWTRADSLELVRHEQKRAAIINPPGRTCALT